ncbi:Phage tail collar domain containing protein [uncultured Caudovirales phage]|uniref:Phage tail collar domain containing protein n=1 Tax=uncultured Caudovirales phage TaxID=2100421 RepID=A0A6J7WTZ4_9CAUD|nr:Phage tail collar domain containing protein [uncultured Caudovirales phage]
MSYNAFCPPGTVLPFAGLTPPDGWLLCNSQGVSRATYFSLFATLSYQLTGTTNSSTTITALSVNPVTLGISVGMPISGTGIQAGTTITSVTATTLVLSLAATSSAVGVAISVCPYGVGNGSTTFNLPDYRGYFLRGLDNMGGTPGSANRDSNRAIGSSQTQKTAVNGLGAAASASSISGTAAGQAWSGSVSGGSYNVGAALGLGGGYRVDANGNATGGQVGVNDNVVRSPQSNPGVSGSNSSSSVSGTAAAQAVSLSGDTETRPINQSCYYIIKY